MSIREIKYNVTSFGVTPANHQWGGVQHEDNATTVSYFISAEYLAELGDVENLRFRIDFNSPSAGYDPSPNLELNNSVLSRDIPQKMTKYGGNIQSTLVISRINTENLPETLEEILQIPSTVFFTSATRQDERFNNNLSAYEEYVGELITEVAENVKKTEASAEQAYDSAEIARIHAENASANNAMAGNAAMYAEQLAIEAETHKDEANTYAYNALASANGATIAEEGAKQAETNAKAFANEAEKAKNNAKTSEENAKASEEEAKRSVEALSNANDIFSNALKGTASGEITGMHDVSPVEHEMGVKVSGVEDLTSVKVMKLGKNLLDINKWVNVGSLNATVSGDSIIIEPQAEVYAIQFLNEELNLQVGKTYTASIGNITDHAPVAWGWRLSYADGTFGYVQNLAKYTFTFDKELKALLFYVGSPYEGNKEITISNIQLELGSTATEYEPYIQPTEYTPNADGVVSGVTSLYPSTTLMTDTDGAVIDATYNRDINKAFEELKNAILATGENV